LQNKKVDRVSAKIYKEIK